MGTIRSTLENPWGLDTSKKGWQAASERLDRTAQNALADLAALTADQWRSISTHFTAAFKKVECAMEAPENARFGAGGDTARDNMARKIEGFNDRHGNCAVCISREGAVSGSDRTLPPRYAPRGARLN